MQQYRLNVTLLIGLIVGSLVCSGVVFGLWSFQMNRKSGWLLAEAEKSAQAKDFRQAEEMYRQYLSIHSDDVKNRIEYANTVVELAMQEEATGEDLGAAQRVLEETLRDKDVIAMPESKQLRRRLVEFYGRENIRRWGDAVDHLDILLQADPNDQEAQALRANYLVRNNKFDEAKKYSFKLIGYDEKADDFDVKKATAPKDPQVYANLAQFLHAQDNKPELAERVLEQLIAVNPDSVAAYMARGRLKVLWGDEDGGRADVEKAFKLKPDDKDVLLFMVDLASKDKDYDKARQYIEQGKKVHPKETLFYKAAATLEMRQKNYDKAIAEVEMGVKALQGQKGLDLLLFKMAELQIPQQDTKGARQTLEALRKVRNLRPEILDYFEASILLAEENWFKAKEALNKLRARISDLGREHLAEIDYKLGLCYEKLGQFEVAREQYKLVTQQNPQHLPASAGLQRVNAFIAPEENVKGEADPLQREIARMLELPKEQRDWSKVDTMLADFAKKLGWDDNTLKIQQAKMLSVREDFAGARKLLNEVRIASPQNLEVYRLLVQLARLDPAVGPEKAMQLWQQVADNFKDPAVQGDLRLDKADIMISIDGKTPAGREKLKPELEALAANADQWPMPQRVRFWGGMAGRFLSLGMAEEARQYLLLAAKNSPNELPMRLALFSLALDANDDAGMQDAQNMILEIVRSKNDPAWQYAEARRKLSEFNRGKSGPETLNEIRALITQALEQRKDWHELYALNAEVELISGNRALALKLYDKAQALGRLTPLAVAKHIRLLTQIGRWGDAAKLVNRIPETSRQAMLGPLYPEILFRTNQVDEALKQAKTAAENDPNNAQNHFWYSQMLARSAQSITDDAKRKPVFDQAIKEMQRTTELQPEFAEAWLALIGYNMLNKNNEQAEKTLRDAQLVLTGDNLQQFLAKAYEALAGSGEPNARWFDAETMYRAVYDANPDDLGRTQQLAAFYLGPVYNRPDRRIKATPLINKILHAGADQKVPAGDPSLLWARRMAAKMYALSGEYQSLRQAENLLASNSQDGTLPIEDKLAMAEILSPRPEPLSRMKAIGLLEEARQLQPLSEQAEIVLGELYYAVGAPWIKYRDQMKTAIARFPKSLTARDALIRKCIERGDPVAIDEATKQLRDLQKLAPNSMSTFELTARLADKIGKQTEVRAELARRLPDFSKIQDMNDEQVRMLEMFANLLVELEDLDTAEKIYRELANRKPEKIYALAKFLGEHRDVAQAFEKLNEVYSLENLPTILETSLAVLRERRDQVGEKFDPEVQRWLDAGLRENPDSITLLVVQADLYDLQKKYPEAAEVYRKLLAREDLTGIRRAVVLNNLSYLVAVAGKDAAGNDDPLKLVDEAASIMGPNSDILDTRAVVLTSRGQFQEAIDDLELSVTDSPTPSKYFHKAQAHYGAKQNPAAIEAWKKAEALGLKRESLNRMEHDAYEKMKLEIDKLRGGSVTRAEPLKKAG